MQLVVAKATNAYLIAGLQDNVIVVVQRDLLDLLGHCFLFSCGQGVPVFCNRLAVYLELGLVAVIIAIIGERSICFIPAVICGNIRIIRKIRHRPGGCPLGVKHITYPVRHFQGMSGVFFAVLCIFLPILHRMSIDTGRLVCYNGVNEPITGTG